MDAHSPHPRLSMSPQNSPPSKAALKEQNAEGSEEDRVFSATLKQLQSLGVNVELNTGKFNRSTVESARYAKHCMICDNVLCNRIRKKNPCMWLEVFSNSKHLLCKN